MNWDYAGKLQKAQMDVADIVGDLTFRLEEAGPPSGGPA
jgi:aldehyde dehydrogenase (NAD+)